MKIIIDEKTFNNAVKENKIELMEWLLLKGCPTDGTAYFNTTNITILEWLYNHSIYPNEYINDVIQFHKDNEEVIEWFKIKFKN